jgi:hypothetical protein
MTRYYDAYDYATGNVYQEEDIDHDPLAHYKRCGACLEDCPPDDVTFKEDCQNYICRDCLKDYTDVISYIKPLNYKPMQGLIKGERAHQVPQF